MTFFPFSYRHRIPRRGGASACSRPVATPLIAVASRLTYIPSPNLVLNARAAAVFSFPLIFFPFILTGRPSTIKFPSLPDRTSRIRRSFRLYSSLHGLFATTSKWARCPVSPCICRVPLATRKNWCDLLFFFFPLSERRASLS